jgi:hypothetical protein
MQHDRFRVRIAVAFVTRNEKTVLLTEYVSDEGFTVRTDAPPRAGDLIRVRAALPPDGAPLDMHAIPVVVVAPSGPSAAPGVELRFFAKSDEVTERWADFLRHIEASHPEARVRPVTLLCGGLEDDGVCAPDARPTTARELLDQAGPGLFLRLGETHHVGTDLRIVLSDPARGASMMIDCVVRRRVFGGSGGIGIELTNLAARGRGALTDFLRAAAPDQPLDVHVTKVFQARPATVMHTLDGPWGDDTPGLSPPRVSIVPAHLSVAPLRMSIAPRLSLSPARTRTSVPPKNQNQMITLDEAW